VLFSKSYDPFWCGSTNIVFLQSGHSCVGKLMGRMSDDLFPVIHFHSE